MSQLTAYEEYMIHSAERQEALLQRIADALDLLTALVENLPGMLRA